MQRAIHTQRVQTDQFEFVANRFHSVLSKEIGRKAVSVIDGRRLGMATGTLLSDTESLTAEARRLCAFSRVIDYELPREGSSHHSSQNTDLPSLSDEEVEDFCQGIIDALLKRYPDITVDVHARRTRAEVAYENSHGVQHQGDERTLTYVVIIHRSSEEDLFTEYRVFDHRVHQPEGAKALQLFVDRLELHFPIVELPKTDHATILTARNLDSFFTGFWQALDGKRLYEKQSPLCTRFGEKLFDERFSLAIDPLSQGTGSFDSEGVASRLLPLVESGVLSGGLYDLEYAQKCGKQASGLATGNVRSRFQTEPIRVPFGTRSLDELKHEAGRGLLIQSCYEVARTTNLKGDFSCGVDALYFEDGQVRGRVKNLNMSANLFDVMRDGLVDLGREGENSPVLGVMAPDMLLKGIRFTV